MPRALRLAPSVPALVLALAIALAAAGCGLALPSEALVERPGLRVVRLTVASANVFVVEQNGKRLMIDAGNPGDEGEYEELMREHGIEPDSIDYLLLTHAHIDHAGTAAYFQRTYGVEVIGGAGDQPMLDRGGTGSTVCPTGIIARAIGWMLAGLTYEPVKLDRPLDGELDLAELGMEGVVVPAPAHTPGSLVAVIGEHAFVGDMIRGSMVRNGTPTTHFFMCDLAQNRREMRDILARDGITTWHPAHFGPFGAEAVRDYLD